MPKTPADRIPVASFPTVGRQLTPTQWRQIEKHLDDWKADVLAAAKRHPAKSYKLGHAQIQAFADLLGNLQGVDVGGMFGGVSPSMRAAEAWGRTYTLRELDDALNVYIGRIKDALLYGLRHAVNPTVIASQMFKATRDASINWRMIARTEMVRANAQGRLDACEQMGFDRVWAPPHVGACASCKRILENQVFPIAQVRAASNFGKPVSEWVATIPLHPQCRHAWLPYDPDVHAEAMAQYERMEAAGLTDEDRLDEMFDSSGQLRPEYAGVDFSAAKTAGFKPHSSHGKAWPSHINSHDALRNHLISLSAKHGGAWVADNTFGAGKQYHYKNRSSVPSHFRGERHHHDGLAVNGKWQQWTHSQIVRDQNAWGKSTGLMDVYAEGLAAVVEKRLGLRGIVASIGEAAIQQVALDKLRPALNQRAIDPDKVLSMHAALRRGEHLPPIEVTAWPNGAMWVDNGQHRAWARELAGETHVDAYVRHDDPYKLDTSRIRSTLGKVWSPLASFEDEEPEPAPLEQLLARFVEEPDVEKTLDSLLWDGLRLRDDTSLAVESWLSRALGPHWPAWAHAYVPAHGGPLEIVTDYDALRAARPEWKHLADTDLHFALVMATRANREQAEIAPGLPLDARVTPGHVPFDGPAWGIAEQAWLNGHPTGTEKSLADIFPRYTVDVDVAKGDAANNKVEHWITIHPHGDDQPGQPVLVRNNADGTMTVIGGAGGNLNYLRLDPKRRIDRADRAKGSKVEQAVSEDEARESDERREQAVAQAHDELAKVQAARDEHKQQLHSYVRDELGIDLDSLDSSERRKMLAKIKTSAIRTLAYGEVSKRDVNDGATAEETGADKDPNAKGLEAEPEPSERTPRPSVAQTADQANDLLDLFDQDRTLAKAASQHRRVIGGEAQASDANQIDWMEKPDADEREKRRRKLAEQEIRTNLARDVLKHGDKQWDGRKYGERYKQTFQQGAYDSLDAFSASVLGHGVIRKETAKLLGVAGTAQLVAAAIQERATSKEGLDLDKVQDALKQLTDEQEKGVVERGLARMKVATERAADAHRELANAERGGPTLYTTTMARSIASEKLQEARRGLGMMIGGLEATSALKTALDRRQGEKIKVGGFSSPAQIKDLARKAGVKVNTGDISRIAAGNYTLSIPVERATPLLRPEKSGDPDKAAALRQIRTLDNRIDPSTVEPGADPRTGKAFDEAVEANREGPGMSDRLDPNQAKGKMFLLEAGSGVLAFDPGVGKTHTALGAAEQVMAENPGHDHRVLIVAPTNMLRSWERTIAKQGKARSVQIIGKSDTSPDKDTGDAKKRIEQLQRDAHYTVISYESLRSYKQHLDGRHSIVIADELQKAKNEDAGLSRAVETAIDKARDTHGDQTHFWGLTGTPVEKEVGDVTQMTRLAQKAKGQTGVDRKTARARYSKVGQDEHIARGDRIGQFRKGLDEHLFRLTAADAGNDLPEPERTHHEVELDPEHRKSFEARVARINAQIDDANTGVREGRYTAQEAAAKRPNFGGRDAMLDELYGREDSTLVKKAAEICEGLGTFEHKGGAYNLGYDDDGNTLHDPDTHAGSYEHKAVVFGSNETSKALFGKGWNKGAEKGGLHAELERRGVKVFVGHGSMSSAQNEENMKAFIAHPGKAVFLTNDKNNAGVSLQFGNNGGSFQHGATHMIHFTRPVNNATIQQREARVLRKGAESKVTYHTISANTPVEQRLQETLERERRTQDLAANSEQKVSNQGVDAKATLAHHLEELGVRVPA